MSTSNSFSVNILVVWFCFFHLIIVGVLNAICRSWLGTGFPRWAFPSVFIFFVHRNIAFVAGNVSFTLLIIFIPIMLFLGALCGFPCFITTFCNFLFLCGVVSIVKQPHSLPTLGAVCLVVLPSWLFISSVRYIF